jgi:hypothetical protein
MGVSYPSSSSEPTDEMVERVVSGGAFDRPLMLNLFENCPLRMKDLIFGLC